MVKYVKRIQKKIQKGEIKMYADNRSSNVLYLPIDSVRPNPYQPRKEMERSALEDLAASIRQYGLMQPVVVRQINDRDFELIAGERRLRACRIADMKEIPAVVVRAGGTDSAVMALIENIQRENLDYIEEAEAFCTLLSEHGITQEELAARLGKKQSTIANKIRILKLSPEIRGLLKANNLSERHARALLRLPDEKTKLKVLGTIISKGLNVEKSEELVSELLSRGQKPVNGGEVKNVRVFTDVRVFSNTIKQAIDMMKRSGIAAESEKTENENYIEYTIKIPKNLQNPV